jgi:hypothetical protein
MALLEADTALFFRPPHLLEASLFAEPAVVLHVLAAGFLFATVARGSSFSTRKY